MASKQTLEEFSLMGKTAVVTGAGRGLGKAIAVVMAEAGADVAVLGRSRSNLIKTVEEIKATGRESLSIAVDVKNAEQVAQSVQEVKKLFGKIDILVNNAGISIKKEVVPLPDTKLPGWELVRNSHHRPMNDEEWAAVLDTNLTGAFLCCKAFGSHMIERRQGKIINISSADAAKGCAYMIPYNVSKAGLNMMTRCLAIEWAPFHINVNAIGPGWFHTDMTSKRLSNSMLNDKIISDIPLKRTGMPREVGFLAVFLASSASDYLTGQTIYLDGGMLA